MDELPIPRHIQLLVMHGSDESLQVVGDWLLENGFPEGEFLLPPDPRNFERYSKWYQGLLGKTLQAPNEESCRIIFDTFRARLIMALQTPVYQRTEGTFLSLTPLIP